MNALILSDKDYKTDLYLGLDNLIKEQLSKRGFTAVEVQVGRDDLAYCTGCFGCWVKKPGECVIKDGMEHINRSYVNSDAVIYLSPVIFGEFSANIKNTLDRWIPNIMPYFDTRPDGSTAHPPRYENYPKHIMIGYGNKLSAEDKQLFSDINLKHRRNIDVLIYEGDETEILEFFNNTQIKKAGAII